MNLYKTPQICSVPGAMPQESRTFVVTGDVKLKPSNRDEETIRLYADTAISLSRLAVSGVVFGKEANNQLRITNVLAKKAGRWQLAAQQAVPIAT